MKDTDTAAAPQTARKKKPYVRPTCTVVPVQIEARLLGSSQGPNNIIRWHVGKGETDATVDYHDHDNIWDPTGSTDRPTVTSKFKNGYWVDDDEEDW